MKAPDLADRHTMEELVEMAAEIRRDTLIPVEERERTGSIHLYPPEARKKLDAIAWTITYKLKERAA